MSRDFDELPIVVELQSHRRQRGETAHKLRHVIPAVPLFFQGLQAQLLDQFHLPQKSASA